MRRDRHREVKLAVVAEASRRVAEAKGRRDKIGLLAAALADTPPDEIEIVAAYLSGTVRQEKVGLGWATIQSAIPEIAAESASVEVAEVNTVLEAISQASGKGSAETKRRLLGDLLSRLTAEEQRFLSGLIVGELRQGALEGLLVEAIARAAARPAADVRRALMMAGDLPAVARAALAGGETGLSGFGVQLFRPILPMLAGSAEDVAAALTELGEAVLEYKLDGARVQIHKRGPAVRVYSRLLNEVTGAVPELVEAALELSAREIIVEGEAIALRPDGTPHPFQITMRRFGRRLDVERVRDEVPIALFLFDILYLDGVPLLDEPLRRRSALLAETVPQSLLVPSLVTSSVEEAADFHRGAMARGHEGVMVKALDAPYEAGRRGRRWLKVKTVRTLDLVVLAAEWGHGRRRGWLSNLHLGARDPAAGGFVMLGKTFKGMTDEMLRWQTERLGELELRRDGHTVHVRPELVVEVGFNDLQASPQYPGGLALRFARVKGYRPDKSATDADTIETVRELYRRQGEAEPRSLAGVHVRADTAGPVPPATLSAFHLPGRNAMTVTPADARPWIERLARAGFAANGVVYLLIGILAFMAAAGAGGDTTGTHGALETLLRQPLGRWLLGLLAGGLFGYSIWRIITAVADPEGRGREGWRRVFVRMGYAGSAVVHGALGWEAVRLALGQGAPMGDDAATQRTAQLMSFPLGHWLVAVAAAVVAGYGIAQIVRGLRGDIDRRLALGSLGPDERRLVIRSARVGMVARGVVFIIMGIFLANASLERDPSEAGGLAEALGALREQPYAPFLLGGVALGLAAYGAFQLARSRYRVIATP